MTLPQWITSRAFVASILASAALAGVIGSLIVAAQQGDDERLPYIDPTTFPHPPYNRWIRPDTGVFEAYVWDDRPVPEAEKTATPWYDPRWKPFSDCMVAEGYEVREDATQPFGQRDLDKIVAMANAERPDTAANKRVGGNIDSVDGIAGAFLRCAGEWLAIQSQDWQDRGIQKLSPGELPEP